MTMQAVVQWYRQVTRGMAVVVLPEQWRIVPIAAWLRQPLTGALDGSRSLWEELHGEQN